MQLLYRDEDEADTILGNLLLRFHRAEPGGQAVRNRLPLLGEAMHNAIASRSNATTRVASIGCGAARELVALLTTEPELGSQLEIALVDQDAAAIQACERSLSPIAAETGSRITFVLDPIVRLIHADPLSACLGARDLSYSAGLFDYLDDDVFVSLGRSLWESLADGGQLLLGNMSTANPSRVLMTEFMDWDLVHRNEQQLTALARAIAGDAVTEVLAEPAGVNLFVSLRKAL